MMRIATVLAMALLSAAPVAAQARYPFVGSWGGGPTTCAEPFVFTATTYRPPGADAMRILGMKRDGASHVLSFKDGYTVPCS